MNPYTSCRSASLFRSGCASQLLAMGCLLALGACSDSAVENLRGRWSGEVGCPGGREELSVVLEVFGSRLGGQGFSSVQGLDKIWGVDGSQLSESKEQPCANDTCTSQQECLDMGGQTCGPQGRCIGCVETVEVLIVELKLEDDNIQLPDPALRLERKGEVRMEGTISSFCPNSARGESTVLLTKQ